ncbi:TPA: hypothetical protein ACS72N_002572 [Providencia alcalifaciens]
MANLYLIQNDTHFKNFMQTITVDDFFIDIGRFTGQNLFDKEKLAGNEIKIPHENFNFFRANSIAKLYFLLNLNSKIKKILKNHTFEKVILGNDGAIQKLIIEKLKNKNSVFVEMWLDGLISLVDNKRINKLKIINSKFFDSLNIGYFFPSVIGFYKRINTIFVMHSSVVDEYKNFNEFISLDKIKPTIFPRHAILLAKPRDVNLDKLSILYLTSAWEFHGRKKEQNAQERQILKLIELLKNNNEANFRIRIHPRDDKEFYEKNNISPWVSNILSFEEDIINSHIVISARSTGLLEAEMIKKTVIIYNEGYGEKLFNSYTVNLKRADSIQELNKLIEKQSLALKKVI